MVPKPLERSDAKERIDKRVVLIGSQRRGKKSKTRAMTTLSVS